MEIQLRVRRFVLVLLVALVHMAGTLPAFAQVDEWRDTLDVDNALIRGLSESTSDTFLVIDNDTVFRRYYEPGAVSFTSDTFYVAYTCDTNVAGWVFSGDTIYVDTCSGNAMPGYWVLNGALLKPINNHWAVGVGDNYLEDDLQGLVIWGNPARVRLGVGGYERLEAYENGATQYFGPVNDNLFDLGRVAVEWKNGYFDGTVITDNLIVDEYVGSTLKPSTDSTLDLGASSYKWKDGYFDGTVYADGLNLDGLSYTTAKPVLVLDGTTVKLDSTNTITVNDSAWITVRNHVNGWSYQNFGTYNGKRIINIGDSAGYANTGIPSVYVGDHAGYSVGDIGRNVAIGHYAMYGQSDEGSSVVIGHESGRNRVKRGSIYSSPAHENSVIMGYQAGYGMGDSISVSPFYAENVSDNIIIGYQAGKEWRGNYINKLIIENSSSTTPLIYGDFSDDSLIINGSTSVTNGLYLDNLTYTTAKPVLVLDGSTVKLDSTMEAVFISGSVTPSALLNNGNGSVGAKYSLNVGNASHITGSTTYGGNVATGYGTDIINGNGDFVGGLGWPGGKIYPVVVKNSAASFNYQFGSVWDTCWVLGATGGAIIGGAGNKIENTGTGIVGQFIVGGNGNRVLSGSDHSGIIGGNESEINASVDNSVIIGGNNITATESNTVYMPQVVVSGDDDVGAMLKLTSRAALPGSPSSGYIVNHNDTLKFYNGAAWKTITY